MAVKFRSVATATNTDTTDATAVTVTKPSQTAEGDILIAVTHGYTADSFVAPSGFVLLDIIDDGSDHRSRAYKKIATSSEPANYTFTFGGAGGAVGCSLAAFSGGHDVLTWANRATTTTDPAVGYDLDAARDSVGWQVYCWRNDTANATVSWSQGTEKHDVTAKSTTAIRRGQSGTYYGPTDLNDIVNAGDELPSGSADVSTAPLFGIVWTFLVGDEAPDNETWSSTDGDFAIEAKMDRVELDSTGGITTLLTGDATVLVSAIAASSESEAAANAADGLPLTNWLDDSTAAPQWIRYDFGASVTKTIKRYRIRSAEDGSSYGQTLDPMNWTFQGSQDASSWSTLDTRTNQAFGNRGETREFRVTTPGAYRYYRLNVTSNYGSAATVGCQLAEFRLSTLDVWEDITAYAQYEDKIRITRGFQGTSGRSDFSRAYFTLDNTDGRFSLRNPNGAYHGAIQRNSEVRISKAFGTKALQLQGAVRVEGTDKIGDCFRTPLTYALAVTSDIEIKLDLDLESWHAFQSLAGMGLDSNASEHGWGFYLDDDGRLNIDWVESGGTVRTARSTIAVPDAVRQSVKVTIDMNNGASGNTTTFYTASTFSGSYTQLGDAVVNSGISNIFYAGGSLAIGQSGRRSPRGLHGKVYNFELLDGIGGSAVADLDFTGMTNGAHTHTDGAGNLWITLNFAVVSNRRYRFHGEVAEWPVAWDPTGNWIYADITAAGVQKRLERGSSTGSVMYRYHTKGIITDPGFDFQRGTAQAYWPMEDGDDSFQVSSGLSGKPHMEVYGAPEFADYSEFNESNPILKLNGSKLGGRVAGSTVGYTDVRFILSVPETIPVGTIICSLWMTGSLVKHDVVYTGTNLWDVRSYTEADLESAFSTQTGDFSVTTVGEKMHVRILLTQSGSDIAIDLDTLSVAGEDLGGIAGTLSANQTLGRIYRAQVNDNELLVEGYMGHFAVYGSESPTFANPVNAYHYERAATRVERICAEEEIEYRQIGAATKSTFMGFQNADSPQAIMSSASHSDTGYLVDPLDAFGVEYRTGRSLFNQEARLTLSYEGFELSGELRPVDDDSYLVNDFTAQRGEAGSARFRLTEGDLSVNPPPDGVGEYADSASFSLAHEGQCVDLASFFVAQGTLDEEHYPSIGVALENARISADSALTEAILDLDIGQRVDITDTPDFLPAQDIRQIVVGYEEWFDNFQHNLKLNTIPERVFESAQYDTTYRFDTAGSELYQDVTAADTTLPVVTTLGQAWSTDGDDFDLWIDGEQVTCTAVSNDTALDTSDTFNGTDNPTSLGNTDGGVIQAWTQNSGTWGTISGQAYTSAALANSVATVPGSADFESLEVTFSSGSANSRWLVFRFTDTSNYLRWGGGVGAPAEFVSRVAGADVRTDFSSVTLASGDILSVRCNGSVIEMFVDGLLALVVTETDNQTATRVGMRTDATDTRFNNFDFDSAVDPQIMTVTRAVNGVSAAHPAGTAVSLYNKPYRAL